MGRPTKLTLQVQERIIAALRAGVTVEIASAAAGIDRSTLYRWKARGERDQRGPYREFFDIIKKAEAEGELTLVAIVRQAAPSDWKAAMTMLERRWPERWGRRDPRLHLEVRREFERVGEALGLDADELVQLAERIANGEDDEN